MSIYKDLKTKMKFKSLYSKIKISDLPEIVSDILADNGAFTVRVCKEVDDKHIFLEVLKIETNDEID